MFTAADSQCQHDQKRSDFYYEGTSQVLFSAEIQRKKKKKAHKYNLSYYKTNNPACNQLNALLD